MGKITGDYYYPEAQGLYVPKNLDLLSKESETLSNTYDKNLKDKTSLDLMFNSLNVINGDNPLLADAYKKYQETVQPFIKENKYEFMGTALNKAQSDFMSHPAQAAITNFKTYTETMNKLSSDPNVSPEKIEFFKNNDVYKQTEVDPVTGRGKLWIPTYPPKDVNYSGLMSNYLGHYKADKTANVEIKYDADGNPIGVWKDGKEWIDEATLIRDAESFLNNSPEAKADLDYRARMYGMDRKQLVKNIVNSWGKAGSFTAQYEDYDRVGGKTGSGGDNSTKVKTPERSLKNDVNINNIDVVATAEEDNYRLLENSIIGSKKVVDKDNNVTEGFGEAGLQELRSEIAHTYSFDADGHAYKLRKLEPNSTYNKNTEVVINIGNEKFVKSKQADDIKYHELKDKADDMEYEIKKRKEFNNNVLEEVADNTNGVYIVTEGTDGKWELKINMANPQAQVLLNDYNFLVTKPHSGLGTFQEYVDDKFAISEQKDKVTKKLAQSKNGTTKGIVLLDDTEQLGASNDLPVDVQYRVALNQQYAMGKLNLTDANGKSLAESYSAKDNWELNPVLIYYDPFKGKMMMEVTPERIIKNANGIDTGHRQASGVSARVDATDYAMQNMTGADWQKLGIAQDIDRVIQAGTDGGKLGKWKLGNNYFYFGKVDKDGKSNVYLNDDLTTPIARVTTGSEFVENVLPVISAAIGGATGETQKK